MLDNNSKIILNDLIKMTSTVVGYYEHLRSGSLRNPVWDLSEGLGGSTRPSSNPDPHLRVGKVPGGSVSTP